MAFSVVYDACVLFPAPLRDLLMRIAAAGLVRANWSDSILDECFSNIIEQRPDLSPEKLRRTRELMQQTIPEALVTGHEPLIESLSLPDPGDRHVLAAAIRCGAQVIVTSNLRDFPAASLSSFGIEAKHPDLFLRELLEIAPQSVCAIVEEQCADLRNPPRSRSDLLGILAEQGLTKTVERLRELFDE
jgi:predicted nucleic acid-binding protein